jgi:hypothetical protein
MLAAPPDKVDAGGHIAIAWPSELVTGKSGDVEGFLMPRIDLKATVPLFQVYNPASRVQIAPAFTWRYLLRTARNVAAIVDSLHRAGYVVGDINESNLLVNRRALAVLVDCDSMQVRDPATGTLHRGGVGKPEFTAPELHGRNLATTDRTPASDDFAVAVLVFQLLMEGVHPFAGIWRGRGEPPDVAARIRAGHFPYRRGARTAPPPHALALDLLPAELRKLTWRAFTTGIRRPGARPTAAQWADALERADSHLRTCDRSAHHLFGEHRRSCPWCERIDVGFPDPYPGPSGHSVLVARPPSRWVSARDAARERASSMARTAYRATTSWLRRLVAAALGSVLSRLRSPLAGAVPVLVASTAVAALLPLLAPVALLGAPMREVRRVRQFRPTLRAAGWRLVTLGAPAVAAAVGATWLLRGGPPPVLPTAATASALLAFSAAIPLVRARTMSTSAPRIALRWAAAIFAVAALALHGPWWWPLPF